MPYNISPLDQHSFFVLGYSEEDTRHIKNNPPRSVNPSSPLDLFISLGPRPFQAPAGFLKQASQAPFFFRSPFLQVHREALRGGAFAGIIAPLVRRLHAQFDLRIEVVDTPPASPTLTLLLHKRYEGPLEGDPPSMLHLDLTLPRRLTSTTAAQSTTYLDNVLSDFKLIAAGIPSPMSLVAPLALLFATKLPPQGCLPTNLTQLTFLPPPQRFVFPSSYSPDVALDRLNDYIEALHDNLEFINIPLPVICPATVNSLRRCEQLRELMISSWDVRPLSPPDFKTIATMGDFKNLSSLTVQGSFPFLQDLIKACTNAHSSALKKLDVVVPSIDSANQIRDWLMAISRFCPQLTVLSMDVQGKDFVKSGKNWADIRPIAKFPNLESFMITHPYPLPFTDNDLSYLLKNWTKAKHLSINPNPKYLEKDDLMITTGCLEYIALYGRSLTHFGAFIDPHNVDIHVNNVGSKGLEVLGTLETLELRSSTMTSEWLQDLLLLTSGLFPQAEVMSP